MRKKRKYTIVNEKLDNKYTPTQIDGSTNLYRELNNQLSVEITGNWKNSFYVVVYDNESELIIDSVEYSSIDELVSNIDLFENLVLEQHKLNEKLGQSLDKQTYIFDKTIRDLISKDVSQKYHIEYYKKQREKYENEEIPDEVLEFYKENRHMIRMTMEYLEEKGVFDEVEIG